VARGSLRPGGGCLRRTSTLVALGALLAAGAANAGATAADNAAVVATAGPPTSIASSADGNDLFVGLDRRFGNSGGIVAYRRSTRGAFEKRGTIDVVAGVRAIALPPDGSALVFTTRTGPGIVAAATLTAGGGTAGVATGQTDGALAGSDRIAVSPDGRYAYYTNERDAALGVASIASAPGSAPSLRIVAHVRLDRSPGGLAVSPDGASVYVTSEIDNVDPQRVPGAADARLGRTSCELNRGPEGVLSVIDARLAVEDPARALRGRIAAGCGPVRVALAPGGSVAWVSVRGDDRALAFDTAKLIADPARALLASIATGPDPVGILVTRDGTRLLVVASDGEAAPDAPSHAGVAVFDSTVARHDDGARPLRTEPAGRHPREIYQSPDGTLWVTDYPGRSIRALAPFPEAGAFGRTPSAAIQRSR
jgi:DNA-binding beta-propeller fold protein YncE